MPPKVVIDFLPEAVLRYDKGHAIVAVDVIRATTTAITAVAAGRRCFPAADLEDALALAERLENPLLAGEIDGFKPDGFELTNSPAQLAGHDDLARPVVLLSSSGTKLMCAAKQAWVAYAACLRNVRSQVEALVERPSDVALIGAGSRGQFRREDQFCCALIARGLVDAGYAIGDDRTAAIVQRWGEAPLEAFVGGESTAFLRRVGELRDLEFILDHVDDVGKAFVLDGDELVAASA